MTRILTLVCAFVIGSLGMMGQTRTAPDNRPQRTPEEEAMKQTTMLIRELNLNDSLQIDSLYHLHLRYAYMRRQSSTRQQDLDRMQKFFVELKGILSNEQYDAFMNHQSAPGPRHPHHPFGQMPPREHEPINRPTDGQPHGQEHQPNAGAAPTSQEGNTPQ